MADLRESLAVYYKSKRLHSTVDDDTPMIYEKAIARCPDSADHYIVERVSR